MAPRHASRFVTALVVIAVVLNWPWEMLQMPAYAEMAGRPWRDTAAPCLIASLGDAAITLLILGVETAATRWTRWRRGDPRHHLVLGAIGGLIAVTIEMAALATGRWSYTAAMPVVPLLGVGLLPVLQLVVLAPAAVAVARRGSEERQPGSRARGSDTDIRAPARRGLLYAGSLATLGATAAAALGSIATDDTHRALFAVLASALVVAAVILLVLRRKLR